MLLFAVLASIGLLGVTACSRGGVIAPAPAALPACASERWPGSAGPGEFGNGCLALALGLDRAPAVGEKARLTATLSSRLDAPAVNFVILLPYALTFDELPRGWELAPVREGDTPQARAVLRSAVEKDHTLTAEFTVRAVSEGAVFVRGAASISPGELISSHAALGLTTATDAQASHLGMGAQAYPELDDRHGPVGPVVVLNGDAPGPGQACVSGYASFLRDGDGALLMSRKVTVEVWDQDVNGPPDLLASGETGEAGYFRVCFDNVDDEGPRVEGGPGNPQGQDPFLVVVAGNSLWRITPDFGDAYRYTVPEQIQPCGCMNGAFTGQPLAEDLEDVTLELGGAGTPAVQPPLQSAVHKALQISNILYDGWAWTQTDGTGGDWGAAGSGSIRVVWSPSAGPDVATYWEAADEIELGSGDFAQDTIVLHELGHAMMDFGYGVGSPLPAFDCDFHTLTASTSTSCAWKEGFAEWFSLRVRADTEYDGVDLEDFGWYDTPKLTFTPETFGDEVEGRVVAVLLDLGDGDNEKPWDRRKDDPSKVQGEPHAGALWKALMKHPASSLHEFIGLYQEDVAQQAWDPEAQTDRILATLFGATVDYDFRDPLATGKVAVRPYPRVAHNFRIERPPDSRWSVVAVRSPETPYGLNLFEDKELGQLAVSAPPLAGVVSFVGIQYGGASPDRLYPQVPAYEEGAGASEYRIEYDEGLSVAPGVSVLSIEPGDLARAVTLTSLESGKQVAVVAQTGGEWLALYAWPASVYYGQRGDALKSAADPNAFGDERVRLDFSVEPQGFGHPGLVVVPLDGEGAQVPTSVTLFVDQTPPLAKVAAAYVASMPGAKFARLTFADGAATDPETGLRAVRFAGKGQSLAASAWIALGDDGPNGPWMSECPVFTSAGGTFALPCTGPTLDVTNALGLFFAYPGPSSVMFEVQTMNGAGLVSDPVTVEVPVTVVP